MAENVASEIEFVTNGTASLPPCVVNEESVN